MPNNIIMADAKTSAPKWQTIDVPTRSSMNNIVNSAGIVPPQNGVIYLRRDSDRVYTSGNVLLGYVITVFNGAVFGANAYRWISATADNPIVPNEHSFFDGTNNNGGNWTIRDGVLYRSTSDPTIETDEKIKVLVIEVPSADSFLPEVST